MGVWTNIKHRDRNLQIRSGGDDYETYKVGDTVKWKIDPYEPGQGKLFDGVYEVEDDDTLWVVIHEHVVMCVIPRTPDESVEQMEALFGIVQYDRDWWSHTLWRKIDLRNAEFEFEGARLKLKYAKEDINCTDAEVKTKSWQRVVNMISDAVITKLSSPSFARKTLPAKPVAALDEPSEF